MTSLIKSLKQERWTNKRKFKREGCVLCTKEATDTDPAIFTTFPTDIAVIKRASNAKLINKRLQVAQQKYYEKHQAELGKDQLSRIKKPFLQPNYFLNLAKQFLEK